MASIFDFSNYFFNPYAIPQFVVGLFVLFLGIYTYRQNKKSNVNLSFLILCSAIFLWLFGCGFTYSNKIGEVVLSWYVSIVFLGSAFIPISTYHFAVAIGGFFQEKKRIVYAGYAMAFFFYILGFIPNTLFIGTKKYFFGIYMVYGPLSIFYLMFFFGFMSMSLFAFWNGLKKFPEGFQRKRIRHSFIGLLIAYIGAIDFLPAIGVEIYPFGYLAILVFVVLIAYSIQKHELFKLNSVIASNIIISKIADSIVVVDPNMKIEVVNNATINLLGYKEEQLLGKEFSYLIKDDVIYEKKEFDNLEQKGEIKNIELSYLSNHGEKISVNITASVIKDKGKTQGFVFIAKDVRETKKMITELREKTDSLNQTKNKLNIKIDELEKFNKLAVGRELKLIELKKTIKKLEEQVHKQ